MYQPPHFLSQIKQMNQRTSVPAYRRSDTIAHADNSIKVVELKRTVDIPVTFTSNYRDFLGCCSTMLLNHLNWKSVIF